MREISAQQIADTVRRTLDRVFRSLPGDVRRRIEECRAQEDWQPAQGILDKIIENYRIADGEQVPICQDTGMACVFLEIGQDVHIAGDLRAAVDEGVRRGYEEGYLRKSVVRDPLDRVNTGDNTPAMLYVDLVPGDRVSVTVAPKGFGSENMSRIKMLRPSDGIDGVRQFVLDTVEEAGPNPCPPIVVGVGIAEPLTRRPFWPKKRLCARLTSATKNRFTRSLNRSFWKKSTRSASARRGSAAVRRRSASISRRCRPISPACPWPSTSTAT